MSITANGSMDCDGHVAVVIVNNTAGDFHGQSTTSSAWIEAVDLAPGSATRLTADVGAAITNVTGAVKGASVEGNVWSPWSANRPAECGAVPTYVPTPVDTTPRPIVTIKPGDPQMCIQPGSNPPFAVLCDSPLATTPWVEPTVPTSAAVDQPVDAVETTAAASTDTDTARPVPHISVKPKAVHPAQLPATGPGDIAAVSVIGSLALVVGVILVTVRRNGVSKATS
jgi:hypothetical protein